MNFSPKFASARRYIRRGFSLAEILVALAVLALMMAILSQMLTTMGRTCQDSQRRVNNFSKARAMLDLLSRDLQAGIYRDDLGAFPGGDFSLYITRPGVPTILGSLRDVSLVRYVLDTSTNSILERNDMAINWNDDPKKISFGTSSSLPQLSEATSRDAAPGVVGFKVFFVASDGTFTTTYSSGVRAAVITIAVIDDKTLLVMQKTVPAKIKTLRDALNVRADGSRSIKAIWEDYLKSEIQWDQYPRSLGSGLKVFERYVVLTII